LVRTHTHARTGVSSTIEHFFYEVATSMDRLLVIMAMLRLGLGRKNRKKTLTFVNTVDQVCAWASLSVHT